MRILLNSDVLYAKRLVTAKLPNHIEQFCRDAATFGAVVVLPRTALLEWDNQQKELAEDLKEQVRGAATLLQNFHITVPTIAYDSLVTVGDLPRLLSATGVTVEVENPLFDDYAEAERRACLHLLPHPPAPPGVDNPPDEMRDLVIWCVALRIAKRDGGAILVARDEVHTHQRGDEEASAYGLRRTTHVDGALELLGRESSTTTLVRAMLGVAEPHLRGLGLPLGKELKIRALTDVAFVTNAKGNLGGSFGFSLGTDKALPFRGRALIQPLDSGDIVVTMTDLTLGDATWREGAEKFQVAGTLPVGASAVEERLTALRETIGGAQ
jgi:hypothetical protein